MKVAILSHGHPALSPGGAERAAYALFEHLRSRDEIKKCIFFASAKITDIGHKAQFGAYHGHPDEILVATPAFEHLTYTSLDYNQLTDMLDGIIDYAKPDVIHLHHFLKWSIESIEYIKRKGARVILTLHEFLAICGRDGQMLKTNGQLCRKAYPAECANCVSHVSAGRFFVRERVIRSYLSLVDHFIAPSHFLAQRYADWGIAAEKISVVENPLSPLTLKSADAILEAKNEKPRFYDRGDRIRIGYFGQINAYKGVDILLRAVTSLPQTAKERLFVGIHGANIEFQPDHVQTMHKDLLAKAPSCVAVMGSYDNSRVLELMDQYDWIIVPSIWWENSPVVIQEAQAIGKPLICGDIGGMAEKGRLSAGTRVFGPGNIGQLATILSRLERPSATVEPTSAQASTRCVEEIISHYGA